MLGTRPANIFSKAAATVDPLLSLTGTANAYRANTSMQVVCRSYQRYWTPNFACPQHRLGTDRRFLRQTFYGAGISSRPLCAACKVLSLQPSLDRFNRHAAVSRQRADAAVRAGLTRLVIRRLHRYHTAPSRCLRNAAVLLDSRTRALL
jgi:hypothetical protein